MIALTAALVGYLAFYDSGVLTETVEVGSDGIMKAQEIKRELK